MASSLSAFLSNNAIKRDNAKVVISDRFVDDGKPIEWELQPIDAGTQQRIRAKALNVGAVNEKGHTETSVRFDSATSNLMTAAASVVFPDLNSVKLQDSYGAHSATELLGKMLYPAELDKLLEECNKLSGDLSESELEDEAKNS